MTRFFSNLTYPWSKTAWDKHGPDGPAKTISLILIGICLAVADGVLLFS